MLVADEQGFSLILALIIVLALSITTAGLTELVQSNEHAFGRDRTEERAFNVAEAGLNDAVSYLAQSVSSSTELGTAVNGTITASGTCTAADPYASGSPYSVDNGSGTWCAVKTNDGTTVDTWKVYSTATVNGVTRNVAVELAANKTTVLVQPSGVWAHGFYVADPTYCTSLVGTATMELNAYIAGNLCLTGTEQIEDPTPAKPSLHLYVGGQVRISGNNASAGLKGPPVRPIYQADIVGGCLKDGVPKTCSSSGASHIYACTSSSLQCVDNGGTDPMGYIQSAQTLTKPPIDAAGIYSQGDWNHPVCSTGSFTFDNNGTRNTSVGTFHLVGNPDFNCTVYKDSSHVAGNEEGTLAWSNATKTLTASGTLYIDGNLAFTGGDIGKYVTVGQGAAIYVDGTVSVSGNSAFCAPGRSLIASSPYGCTGTWNTDPSSGGGGISISAVNAGNVTGCSPAAWSMSGNAAIDVITFVTGCFSESGTSYVTGPVTTDQAVVAGTPDHFSYPDPPPDTPGAKQETTASAWGSVVPSTWSQQTG